MSCVIGLSSAQNSTDVLFFDRSICKTCNGRHNHLFPLRNGVTLQVVMVYAPSGPSIALSLIIVVQVSGDFE